MEVIAHYFKTSRSSYVFSRERGFGEKVPCYEYGCILLHIAENAQGE